MKDKITRRKFIILTAFFGGLVGALTIVGVNDTSRMLRKRKSARDIVRSKKQNINRWFTPGEYALVSVLAALIIPTDETGIGASEANVVNSIDLMVSKSQEQQILYREGLEAFDDVARDEYGRVFVELTNEQQISILNLVDHTLDELKISNFSLLNRINRKVKYYYYKCKPGGLGGTIDLFPKMVKDVKREFYTSKVAWDWLGYDGPPQPGGYIGRVSECA